MSIRANTDRTRLNERPTFDRLLELQDENTGRLAKIWSPLVTCWAAIDGQKASDRNREPVQAQAPQSISEYTVWVRADIMQRYGIGPADRMRWKGKVFDIRDAPDQQLRGRLIAIFCTVNKAQSTVTETEVIISGGGDP